jgi:transcriptional regulator of acetoin/glycerol metabolism
MRIRRNAEVVSEEQQKAALKQWITDCTGNITAVARATGLARSHVNELIRKYDLVYYARDLRRAVNGSSLGRRPSKSVQ